VCRIQEFEVRNALKSERASSLVVKGFRLAPPVLGLIPLGGEFSSLIKKSPRCASSALGYDVLCTTLRWAVAEWTIDASLLVMGARVQGFSRCFDLFLI
jgi:hypothetical protein